MKIKEGLVYNKHSGSIIGFTDLGDINNELMRPQQDGEHPPIANHVLVLMVRGIFLDYNFPMLILEPKESLLILCTLLFGRLSAVLKLMDSRSLVSQLMVIVPTENFLGCIKPRIF